MWLILFMNYEEEQYLSSKEKLNSNRISKMSAVDLTFARFIKCWKLTGIYPATYNSENGKVLHLIAVSILHVFVVLYFPLSMAIALLSIPSFRDMVDNVSISMTMFSIMLKGVFLRVYIQNFKEIISISKELEERFVKEAFGEEQLNIFRTKSTKYFNVYAFLYSVIVVLSGLSMLTFPLRTLRYPAYFPFNVYSNDVVLISVKIYQYVGSSILVFLNLFYDVYPPILIYLLEQNMNILADRVSKIGSEEGDENRSPHELLREAIDDSKTLFNCFDLLNELMSPSMFAMFLTVIVNLCAAILLIVYFAENAVQAAFFGLLGGGNSLEIALACYYGSEFEDSMDNLVKSIYSCNWTCQSKDFKKDLMIFVENCMHEREFTAGGFVPITLITFQKVVNTSYSYYTVMSQMT